VFGIHGSLFVWSLYWELFYVVILGIDAAQGQLSEHTIFIVQRYCFVVDKTRFQQNNSLLFKGKYSLK
jgi:hypothetical protein